MKTGEKIHKLRIQNKLTLKKLGDMVGVERSTVAKWESGIITNMKRDKILKVSEVLGTTPAYLMGWDEDEKHIEIHAMNKVYHIKLKIRDSTLESTIQAISKHEAIGKALEIVPTATYKNIIEIKEDT